MEQTFEEKEKRTIQRHTTAVAANANPQPASRVGPRKRGGKISDVPRLACSTSVSALIRRPKPRVRARAGPILKKQRDAVAYDGIRCRVAKVAEAPVCFSSTPN